MELIESFSINQIHICIIQFCPYKLEVHIKPQMSSSSLSSPLSDQGLLFHGDEKKIINVAIYLFSLFDKTHGSAAHIVP